ncbi:MAG: hypothetical protein ACE5LX_06395, partial [Nitrospinota bacterium]
MGSLRGPRERFLARIERALEKVEQGPPPELLRGGGKENTEAAIKAVRQEAHLRLEELLEQFIGELELASGE